ncbi:MAG: glycosyltransferase family 9 protein [Candidatus Hinthialibacter antarcticus]|nr:glycosyltransferase family 9 protein [Candidatus Hinthialibacter antarcticus]
MNKEGNPEIIGASARSVIPTDGIERILFVRLSALGDCISSMPVLCALRRRFPKAHIAWLIQDNSLPIIQNLKMIDEVIVFPRARWREQPPFRVNWREAYRLVRHLRMRRFDLVVDVQSNSKSSVLSWLSGAKYHIGHGKGQSKEISHWFIKTPVAPDPNQTHIIPRSLKLLEPLGVKVETPEFSLPKDDAANTRMTKWLERKKLAPKSYCLLAPFCSTTEKEWPPMRYSKLAGLLANNGTPVVALNAPGREETVKQIVKDAQSPQVFAGPSTSIVEMVELVRMAKGAVGGDTGPMQIAGALGVPSIAFFGPTDPNRTGPWGLDAALDMQVEEGPAFDAITKAMR